MNHKPFKYNEIRVDSWNELSATMKVEMVLNTINELYFPYTQSFSKTEEKTYNNYWEFADDIAKIYDLTDVNLISTFWGTEWSESGKRERFTKIVKEIVNKVMVELYGVNPHEYFMEHSYFTAWKSHSVKLIYEDEVEDIEFDSVSDQWDSWKLGFVNLIILVINHLED